MSPCTACTLQPGLARQRPVGATGARCRETVRALPLDYTGVHLAVRHQLETGTGGRYCVRAPDAVHPDEVACPHGRVRPVGAMRVETGVPRDHVLLDAVAPRRDRGPAAEVDTAEVVDHQVTAHDGDLRVRREGERVTADVPEDDVVEDACADRRRCQHPGAVEARRDAVALVQDVTSDQRRAGMVEHNARTAGLLESTRPHVRAGQRGRETPQDHGAGDAPVDRVVAGADHKVGERQVPRRLGRLDAVCEDRAGAARCGSDRDSPGRGTDRGDHLTLGEGGAGRETSRLPGRERACKLGKRQERGDLRPRVRVDAVRSCPEIAADG